MKLVEKISLLKESMLTKKMATCYFTNDNEYIHYYVREVNDKFFLGLEEFDFDIRGYEIRKLSRIKKVVFGAFDKNGGACDSVCNLLSMPFSSRPEVWAGIMEEECKALLEDFFKNVRQ